MEVSVQKKGFFSQLATACRVVITTLSICCLFYTLLILGIGQTVTTYSANGSLLHNEEGEVIGSELISQRFSRPEYFWPRPSFVDYNASASGGSNLSPANPGLCTRALDILSKINNADGKTIPADLVAASGSGLDPHITLNAARYQAERVASARGLSVTTVVELLDKNAKRPGGVFTSEPLVNVLLVNISLDKMGQ